MLHKIYYGRKILVILFFIENYFDLIAKILFASGGVDNLIKAKSSDSRAKQYHMTNLTA